MTGPIIPADRWPDEFKGDNAKLIGCINALLSMDAAGALVPHGIGGHARSLLSAAAHRLAPAPAIDLRQFRELLNQWKGSEYPLSYEGTHSQRALDACIADLQALIDGQADPAKMNELFGDSEELPPAIDTSKRTADGQGRLLDLAETWVYCNPDPSMTARQAFACCARALRELYAAPQPAPAIDLRQFREAVCAYRLVSLAGLNDCEAHGVKGHSFGESIEHADRLLALIDGQAAPRVDLAADHTGMRVDYSGLIGSAQRALLDDPGISEMLRQLCRHLEELGRRWYAGDRKVVDEFLQLYCIESEARAALVKQPTKGDGVVTAPRGPDQPDLCDLCRVRDEVRTDADGIPFCQECWDGWQASEQPTKGEGE